MNTTELIEKFYTSFAQGNVSAMMDCYHAEIVFQDPAFGELHGDRAVNMWKMLLSQKSNDTKITFGSIEASDNSGHANWKAEYDTVIKKEK